jgi:hypothetical protein
MLYLHVIVTHKEDKVMKVKSVVGGGISNLAINKLHIIANLLTN